MKASRVNAEALSMMNLPQHKCGCGLEHSKECDYKSYLYNNTTGSLDLKLLIDKSKSIGPLKVITNGAFS